MTQRRLKAVDWSIKAEIEDFNLALTRFETYLKDYGLRDSTISDYKARVGRFLRYAQTDQPSTDTAKVFREQLILRNSARSSVNNYSFALKRYLVGGETDL